MIERKLVFSKFTSPNSQLNHFALFHDLWMGRYKLEEINCVYEQLKKLIERCTNRLPVQRPNLEECSRIIDDLNELTMEDSFQPLIIDKQQKVVRPIGFDGTNNWVC
ncbi:unnamed protein product, partial [Mesorhabditis belari]|uniref:Uncharacterized protein n=1 Tax=Mesorhabditis belari TaxID=2138241 RepID=A0AAF3EFQ5_9BILA